jgi:hypothetical protein
MAKPKRPFPGMRGKFVLGLNYDGTWVAHMGANDANKLRRERQNLRQWPDNKVAIFTNNIGDPSPEEQAP